MKKYAVIGEKLSHTLSPQIHKQFFELNKILADYDIVEIEKRNFAKVRQLLLEYNGVNVTVPYKQEIMQYLDDIHPFAKKVGAVNTVTTVDGKLIGYNSDVFGFDYLLKISQADVKDKDVVVVGSGGASKAVCCALLENKPRSIVVVCRDIQKAQREFIEFGLCCLQFKSYDFLEKSSGYAIINTTSVGMFPNVAMSPLDMITDCDFEFFGDIIYNPSVTKFCKFGINKNSKVFNGLPMLVAQAIKSQEIWGNGHVDNSIIKAIYCQIAKEFFLKNQNLIFLSGMMGCGKSTVAKMLADQLGYEFIDLDNHIQTIFGMTIDQMFAKGEEFFRQCESKALADVCTKSKCVVALGGGCVVNDFNYSIMKISGITLFLDRDIEKIQSDVDIMSRPLLKDNPLMLQQIYIQRKAAYFENCDFVVENNKSPNECVGAIIKILDMQN